MKVTGIRNKVLPVFEPITITITFTSQEEAQALRCVTDKLYELRAARDVVIAKYPWRDIDQVDDSPRRIPLIKAVRDFCFQVGYQLSRFGV